MSDGNSKNSAQDRISGACPLRGLYRRLHPIPKSPRPRFPEEAHLLKLVPCSHLTERLAWSIEYLTRGSGAALHSYLEFGVYNGSSMICMHNALLNSRKLGIRLVGFDSFQGLPPNIEQFDDGVWLSGQFACPRPIAEANLNQAGVASENLFLVEGWYQQTLLVSPAAYGIEKASIVMIDCDAYPSAKLALNFIAPVLATESILIFDDWKLNDLDLKGMGEYRAFKEFMHQHPEFRAKAIRSYNRKSKMFILRRDRGFE